MFRFERLGRAVVIDHHRVVDDQVHRHQRLDGLGVLAHALRDGPHGGEVGQQRHTGEVLQHDARHYERDLVGAVGDGLPVGKLLDVFGRDLLAITVAKHGFEHDPDRDRQALDVGETLGQDRQRVQLARLAGSELEVLEGLERIVRHGDPLDGSSGGRDAGMETGAFPSIG
jgi:hypothetical protein